MAYVFASQALEKKINELEACSKVLSCQPAIRMFVVSSRAARRVRDLRLPGMQPLAASRL